MRRAVAGKGPRGRAVWWVWIGYWALLLVIMHLPVPTPELPRVRHGDKAAHALIYFILVRLGGHALARTRRGLTHQRIVGWGVVYALYAAADELLQGYVGRTPSLADWLADVAGVAAASASLYFRPPGKSGRHPAVGAG